MEAPIGRAASPYLAADTHDLPAGLPAAGQDLLVALDIDGTLLGHDGSMSDGVREAVGRLSSAGAHVVLSTGRSVAATVPVAHQLGIDTGVAVCANGAVCVRLDPGLEGGYEITDIVTFDPGPVLRELREALPEGILAVELRGEEILLSGEFPPGELTATTRVVPFEEMCEAAATRVVLRAPGQSAEDFHALVERVGLHGVTYAVGWTAWLDIAPNGVSKASALEMLRSRLGVGPHATVAMGDGRNDIEMLGWAAHGVAMGDADEVTRASADALTRTVAEDGAVAVLRALYAR